jgi:hypothetical protein
MERVPKPKYLEREMKAWKKAEYDTAKILGGKRVRGSGNQVFSKGDVQLDDYLVEVKSTDYNSILLYSSWLVKIEEEARGVNKKPMLVICFNKLPAPFDKWAIVPLKDLEKLGGNNDKRKTI